MATTFIKKIVNNTDKAVTITNLEEHNMPPVTIPQWSVETLYWDVPWAKTSEEFDGHHFILAIPAADRVICIWQHDDHGDDRVRYSTDGKYHCMDTDNGKPATTVPGTSDVGGLFASNERDIVIDTTFAEGFVFNRAQ